MKRLTYPGALSLALAALGAFGLLASTGCSVQAHGGGDVYCDQRGCYECSGASCTPTPGPGETSGSSGSQVSVDSGPIVTVTGDAGDAAADASQADATPPPPPDCATTSDCNAEVPQACVAGYCRYTCTTNQECAEIDARLDVCSGDDAAPGYCVSSSD